MSGLLSKLMNFAGFESEVEDEEEQRDDEKAGYDMVRPNTGAKVLNLQSPPRINVIIASISSFEEACGITDNLRAKKPVIINLENMSGEESRRMIDFLSGVVCAIDGSIQKITSGIFFIAPFNVEVTADFRDEFMGKSRNIFGDSTSTMKL